ncbi:MAG: glycosyltransferase family 4 protein [Bacteroidetes bacterium]|nr:glycosyltransferase family 4 protein [Bacteroidota bacterium]
MPLLRDFSTFVFQIQNRRMNICICTSSFPLNRDEVYHRYLEDLILLLHNKGHEITILTQEKRGKKEKFIPHAEVVWFPWKIAEKEVLAEVSFKKLKNILSLFSLLYNGARHSKKIVREKKIDIFICLWIVPSGLYVFLKNIFSKKTPYLLWSLGSDIYNNKDNFFTRLLLRLIINNSKAVFADGLELCDIIQKISSRKSEFLPTFHKINIPEASLADNPIAKKEITFLYVGRLTHVKGIDVLIEAFKLLKEETGSLNFTCTIIGDGEMMASLLNEVKKNNLTEKVLFIGKITDEKVKAGYYNKADCIIIPSRSESIPVVLSEAVQYGKPLITTNAGDMELIVKKYNLGLVAEKENPVSLASTIKKFIAQPLQINQKDKKDLLDTLLFENSSQKLLDKI